MQEKQFDSFLEALETNTKASGTLVKMDDAGNLSFCASGLLAFCIEPTLLTYSASGAPSIHGKNMGLGEDLRERLGIPKDLEVFLIELNDSAHLSFIQIRRVLKGMRDMKAIPFTAPPEGEYANEH